MKRFTIVATVLFVSVAGGCRSSMDFPITWEYRWRDTSSLKQRTTVRLELDREHSRVRVSQQDYMDTTLVQNFAEVWGDGGSFPPSLISSTCQIVDNSSWECVNRHRILKEENGSPTITNTLKMLHGVLRYTSFTGEDRVFGRRLVVRSPF